MHVIIWQLRAKPGLEREFEKVYGPGGDWALLFQKAEGYLGTELFRETERSGTYVTIDRWNSRAAFQAFRDRWLSEYETLDAQCESLTEQETSLGWFEPAV